MLRLFKMQDIYMGKIILKIAFTKNAHTRSVHVNIQLLLNINFALNCNCNIDYMYTGT